jgi:hypothetical protein
MVDLGPTHPDDPRAAAARQRHLNGMPSVPTTPAADLLNYWAKGPGSEPLRKPAAERTYSYVQTYRHPWDIPGRTRARKRRYIVRVAEDHAGRRVARTERFDPERGSGPNCQRVDLPDLMPKSITIPMVIFSMAITVIMIFLPLPILIPAVLAWALFGWTWMYNRVERARFAKHLRKSTRDYDLPPLLSEEELDARVFKLANPDENRTFDDPAPIPMAKGLRDPAWKRWEDQLGELPDQEYNVGCTAYKIKRNNGFADGPDHPLYRLIQDVRGGMRASYPQQIDYVVTENGARCPIVSTPERDVALRPLFEDLGREVLGPERVAELEDRRRAAAHGEPMLDRCFAARTDCADGHVGEHPILSTFTDSNGNKRVRRGCRWCPGSAWSELV